MKGICERHCDFKFYVNTDTLKQQSIEKEKVEFDGCSIYVNHATFRFCGKILIF